MQEIKLVNGVLRLGMNKLVADTEEKMLLSISEAFDMGFIHHSAYGLDFSQTVDRGKFYCCVWK